MSFPFMKLAEKGAGLLEVSLIAALIGVACIYVVSVAGGDTAGQFAIATCASRCGNGSTNESLRGPEDCAIKFQWLRNTCPHCDKSKAAKELLDRVASWCN